MMSAVHRYHPDEDRGDPPDAVLWDDCERCDQHAKHPGAGLDAAHLLALYTLAEPQTENARVAQYAIDLAVALTRKIDGEVDRVTGGYQVLRVKDGQVIE